MRDLETSPFVAAGRERRGRIAPALVAVVYLAFAVPRPAISADEPPSPPGASREEPALPPEIEPHHVLEHDDSVNDAAFSPDGKLLAVACGAEERGRPEGPGLIVLWDAATRRRLADLHGHYMEVDRVAFSPDGKTLASGGVSDSLALWDIPSRNHRIDLIKRGGNEPPPRDLVGSIDLLMFGPDGKTFAFCCERDRVRFWDLPAGRERPPWLLPRDKDLEVPELLAVQYAGRPGEMRGVLQHWSTRHIFDPGSLRLWMIGADQPVWSRPIKGHCRAVLSPDGSRLAMSVTTGFQAEQTVSEGRLLDARTGKDVADLPSRYQIHAMNFSQDGCLLATSEYEFDPARFARPGEAIVLRLRDGRSGRELAACRHHKLAMMRLAFSPDGKTLAAWGYGSTVRLWDVDEILAKGTVKVP